MARPKGVEKIKFICSLPKIPHGRMMTKVKDSGLTVTAYVEGLIRADLDGMAEVVVENRATSPPATNGWQRSAGVIAAGIPGVRVGIAEREPAFNLDDTFEEVPAAQDWMKVYMEASEMEAYEAERYLKGLVGAGIPAGFWRMPGAAQVKWLKSNR